MEAKRVKSVVTDCALINFQKLNRRDFLWRSESGGCAELAVPEYFYDYVTPYFSKLIRDIKAESNYLVDKNTEFSTNYGQKNKIFRRVIIRVQVIRNLIALNREWTVIE